MKINTNRKNITKNNIVNYSKSGSRAITILVLLAFAAVIVGIIITIVLILNMVLNPSIPGSSTVTKSLITNTFLS